MGTHCCPGQAQSHSAQRPLNLLINSQIPFVNPPRGSSTNLVHWARGVAVITCNSLSLFHSLKTMCIHRCKCVSPPSLINYTNVWLYRLGWICTRMLYCCADRAYCLFGENRKISTCSSKEDYIISPPLSPLSLSDFWFNLSDGLITALCRHMEMVT